MPSGARVPIVYAALLGTTLALGGCGGPPPTAQELAVSEQIALLAHHDGAIRGKAASVLGSLPGGERAGETLIAALRDREAAVRERAAQSLGLVRMAAAVPALTRLLKDAEPSVRAAALQALAAIDPAAMTEPATAALADAEPGVRQIAARALIGAPDGIRRLSTALTAGGPATGVVAEALARSPDPAAATTLVAGLSASDAVVRLAVVGACGDAKLEAAVPALGRMLERPSDRAAALAALGRIGSVAAAQVLVGQLAAKDAATVSELVKDLGATARAPLIALLAARGTGPSPDLLSALLMATGSDAGVDAALLTLIGHIGDPLPVARFLRPRAATAAAAHLLARIDAGQRSSSIITALAEVGRVGGPESARCIALAQDASVSEEQRQQFITAAVRIGDPAVVPLLRPRLGSNNFRVLRDTIAALARLGDASIVPTLVTWLTERTHPQLWFIALSGLPALVDLAPDRALPVLRLWVLDNPAMTDVRGLALNQAARLDGPSRAGGIALIAEALTASAINPEWRSSHVAPLLRQLGPAATPFLVPLLAKDGPAPGDDPGWWAAELIAEAGDPAPVLALDRSGVSTRAQARILRALCMPRQPAAVAAVADFLASPDPILRRTAAGLIGRYRLPLSASLAAARTTDSDAEVRAALDDAIAQLRKP